jgi:NitT/TauT family transport system permease protein
MKKLINIVIVFLAWELVAFVIHRAIVPYPYDIFAYMFSKGFLYYQSHIAYSLIRLLIGLSLTIIVSLFIGILAFDRPKIKSFVDKATYWSYPIPKMSLLPIVMMFLGLSESTKITMIFLITFFPAIINIRDALELIPESVLELFYSLGASKKILIKRVLFPAILPAIFTSMRISVGIALSVLFFTENFGTTHGLGYLIMNAWMRIDYTGMYAGVFIISLIGVIMYSGLDFLGKKACPWLTRR